MDLPPNQRDPEAVRSLADQILREGRFQRPPKSLPDRILTWLGEQIGKALELLVGGGGGTAVAWLILVGAVGGVIYLLVRFGRVSLPAMASPDEPEVMVELTRSGTEWRREAERLEGLGRWAEGLRARHRALVADLVRRDAIPDRAGRTAGEYVGDVQRTLPDGAPCFAAATELFEAVWYGGAPTGAAEAARFDALAVEVLAVKV